MSFDKMASSLDATMAASSASVAGARRPSVSCPPSAKVIGPVPSAHPPGPRNYRRTGCCGLPLSAVPAPAAFAEIAARVNNWGRWGADDQLGTLNLVDADARRRAAAAVRRGEAYPLGLALSEADGIQAGLVPGRVNPTRTMVAVNEPLSA